MLKRAIDINVDIGEGYPFDRELMQFATTVNIGLGVHAGSHDLTQETIQTAIERGLRWGLHPGYPDPDSMGRKSVTPETARPFLQSVFDQVRRWVDFAEPAYIKPHGAFYNDTAVTVPSDWPHPWTHEETALWMNQFIGVNSLGMLLRMHKLPILGLPGTTHEVLGTRSRHGFIAEGFADRRYEGARLAPRSTPNALVTESTEIEEQTVRLATMVDSICIHGDHPNATANAETVYRALTNAGYEVRK